MRVQKHTYTHARTAHTLTIFIHSAAEEYFEEAAFFLLFFSLGSLTPFIFVICLQLLCLQLSYITASIYTHGDVDTET